MKDSEKTIGNMIDKQTVSFIASIDEDGFPNMKAMLQPRKREGIKIIYFTTNTSSMRVVQYRKERPRIRFIFVTGVFSWCHAAWHDGSSD